MTGITLPTDTQQSRLVPRPTPQQEDVLDTLREYERLARVASPDYTIATRFSADGETWQPFWLSKTPPAVVHTVVNRDGVVTEEWRSWDEALPADDASCAEWLANPATRHRAFTERATLRRAFADVIVGRELPAAPKASAGATVVSAGTAIRTATADGPTLAATLDHPWDDAPQTASSDVWAPAPAPSDVLRRPRPLDHLPTNRAGRRAHKRKGARRGR